ncbi:MAG: lytic transglycosylase domain-containing protein [Burkholderia sp.]
MLEFLALAQECAPTVAPQTMAAVVNVESSYNPYAIGVVGGRLARQPASRDEAVATAKQLASDGWNFSVGVAQVNRYNLPKYEVTYEQAFDTCTNLRVGSKILEDCYVRASKRTPEPQAALHAAFSCYYSGNFSRGFKPDVAGKPSYVQKVLASAGVTAKAIPVVPSIQTGSGLKPQFDKAADSMAPAALKVQSIEPAAPPSDNAPVLLRPSNPAGGTAVRLQLLATGAAGGQLEGVAKETGTAGDEAAPAEKAEPRSTAIV